VRLVAYLQVSTDTQAEHGLGLDIQEASCRTWARAHGHRLARVVRDEGASATLTDRDGLAEALELVAAGEAGGILVARLDRLARDLVVQEQLLAEVWRLGGEVYSAAGGEADLRDDPDDPSRRLIRQVLGAVPEFQRAMTALRLRRGRRRKAEQGGYAGDGPPPFGWRARDRALVVDDREAAALERIRQLHGDGLSLRQIIAVLDTEGHAPKRGGRWHPQTLARIIARLDQPTADGHRSARRGRI